MMLIEMAIGAAIGAVGGIFALKDIMVPWDRTTNDNIMVNMV